MYGYHYFHIARFVLEARTPLSIATGSPDGVFDSALVRDANGLPAIPGSSLAGVLRHLYRSIHDEAATRGLFGFQDPDSAHADNGKGSRVQVAWGAIQDSRGRAVNGLALGEQRRGLVKDHLLAPVLAQVDEPVIRNRVRIGARGAAADTGRYDRAVLAAGHRFACELLLWDDDEAEEGEWPRLLKLLRDPRLRLGGATRAGLGRMTLESLYTGSFDLRNPDEAAAYRRLGPNPDDRDGLEKQPSTLLDPPAGWIGLSLSLQARDFWRIGQGHEPLGQGYDKTPDGLPVLEERVVWEGEDQARRILSLPLVPGSSVKGALAHRVAFYANCLEGKKFAEEVKDPAAWDKSHEIEGSKTVKKLFGYSKHKAEESEPTGQAGRVFIDDAFVKVEPESVARLMHNAIDRFTGGVRDRLLFSEELLWQTPVQLECLIDTNGVDTDSRRALRLALDDLLAGRLALGAGGGKGHGRFTGSAEPDLDTIHPRENAA